MSEQTEKPKRDAKGRYLPKSSGNLNGRPRKGADNSPLDVMPILTAPVPIRINGDERKVSPAEAYVRHLVIRAMKGDLKAALKCVGLAEKHGLLTPAPRRATYPGGAVLQIPGEWTEEEFIEMYKKYGDPPWPGERDGLIPQERRTKGNPNGMTVT